jgi:hypothetical protein
MMPRNDASTSRGNQSTSSVWQGQKDLEAFGVYAVYIVMPRCHWDINLGTSFP